MWDRGIVSRIEYIIQYNDMLILVNTHTYHAVVIFDWSFFLWFKTNNSCWRFLAPLHSLNSGGAPGISTTQFYYCKPILTHPDRNFYKYIPHLDQKLSGPDLIFSYKVYILTFVT